jgi:hypothetical protein
LQKRVAAKTKKRGGAIAECSRMSGVACCEDLKTAGFRYGQREDIKESSNAKVNRQKCGAFLSALNRQLEQLT